MIEAVSYLVLLVATVVKRTGISELGVTIFGPIHGILFLAFAFLLLRDRAVLGWPLWRTFVAIFVGSLPFGGFWVDRRMLEPFEANQPG